VPWKLKTTIRRPLEFASDKSHQMILIGDQPVIK